MKIGRQIGGLVATGVLVFTSVFSGTAFAAGAATVSVEPSASAVTAGDNVTMNFYVTASGENLFGVSVDVNFVNLTYVSYDSTGAPFNGYDGVPSGGSAGSTSFTVAGSYQAPSGGGTGKILIGKVTAQASGSAGTAQINLSNAKGVAVDESAMDASAANKTVAINSASAPTCPAGQIGTPPNCTTPANGGGGNNTPVPTNSTTNPNTKSKITVPSSTSASSGASAPTTGEVKSEQDLATVFTSGSNGSTSTVAKITPKAKKSSVSTMMIGLSGLALLAIVGGAAYFLIRQRRGIVAGSAATGSIFSSSMSDHTPKDVSNSDSDHDKPSTPGGPTIITPHN